MNSKKLLVFSDSHGSVTALKAVFNWAKDYIPPNGTICMTACLGDGLSDLGKAADETGFYSEWKLVCGNNDFNIHAPEAAVFDFCEHRFYMCHGHRQALYYGFSKLLTISKHNEAEVALFGHSHVPYCKKENGILLVNPGSVGQPRSAIGATFAVIECTEDEPVKAEFFGIKAKGSIKKIKLT